MSTKTSTLYSMLSVRCPRCHTGKMFPEGTLYNPAKFATMNENCSCCGLTFKPEPGYYYGAMFVSYALNTAWMVALWIGLSFFVKDMTITLFLYSLLFVIVGLLPITYRWSRAMWISIFVRYEGQSQEKICSNT